MYDVAEEAAARKVRAPYLGSCVLTCIDDIHRKE